jgi:PAS domain S-box-containing protein
VSGVPIQSQYAIDFLAQGGETGALIQAFDWPATALGDIQSWPQSLKSTVGFLLRSPVAIVLLWGDDGHMIYNDAYSRFAGGRHPELLGRKVREGWPEVADFNDNVMRVGLAGGTLSFKDQELTLHRNGIGERAWMNLDYSPVLDETGQPAGVIAIVIETTDRIRADLARGESELRFREVADAAPVLIWLSDTSKAASWFNKSWLQFTGRTMEEESGDGWAAGVHQDDVARCLTIYNEAFDRRETFRMDYRLRRNDGNYRVIDANGVPRFAADGSFLGYIGSCADVTEARAVESELRKFNETLEAHVEERTREWNRIWTHARDLILVMSSEGNFRAVSPAWKSVLGHAPNDLIGRHFTEFVHPEDLHISRAAIETVLSEGALSNCESRWLHLNGDSRWISWHASLENNLIYAYGRDISVEKTAIKALELSQARLRAIFETNYQFQGLLTVEGMLLDANATSLTAINCSLAEVIGRPFWETPWFAGTPGVGDSVRAGVAAAAAGQSVREEIRVNLPVGGWRWFEFALRPIRDANEQIVAIVPEAIELTERREAEDALRQSQKMEVVGQLTGGIAHDFNNLLAAISGSLELLQQRIDQGRIEGIERYISSAQVAATRAASLTQRLLAFSRRQTLDPRTTDVNKLIAGMTDLLRRTMGPNVSIEVVGAGGVWLTKIDRSQMENALLNLCLNARDAMPDGGRLTIETANKWLDDRGAREHDLSPGQYVCVSVSDTGAGMLPAVIAHAFDPFFTTKPLGQGTGLGLSMIYGFVRQSGGQVRIYSEIGSGTTMSLYLPRFLGEAEVELEADKLHASDGGHGETILIVDDEQTIRMVVAELLEEIGYRTMTASDGASALKIIQSAARIDLLITDVGLPGGINGRQVADAARTLRSSLKVLFITGYAENAAIGNGHLAPDMQVLTKPFVMAALAGKVREMIDGKRRQPN